MKLPLFRTTYFNNMAPSSKKPATVSVRLTRTKEDLIYVKKVQSSNEVVGYKAPTTNLFITKLRKDDTKTSLTHNMFRDLAWRYAQEKVTLKLKELKALMDEDQEIYKSKYKPLAIIESELTEFLSDKHDFFLDLEKQISVIRSNPRPHTNEYVLYIDDVVDDDMFATIKLPYKNPAKQILEQDDIKLVDDFLDAFVDNYNKRILSWYFGAVLCNIPVYDERISKMLVVSSAHGGSGKNTLINSLTNGLLTDAFREIKSSFDTFFISNNRFGSSQILPLRVIQYSEAEFNDAPNGSHNFDGLNVSEIKSMISEGYLTSEKKYDDMQTDRLSSMHVVLTNHPPVIDADRSALNRRILPLIVKPSKMVEKGAILGLETEQQVYDFVEDHMQAFANYFAQTFLSDERAFTDLEYSHSDMASDIQEGEDERLDKLNLDNNELRSWKEQDIETVIYSLGKKNNVDVKKLIDDIRKAKNAKTPNTNLRWDGSKLFMNSAKDFFISYGKFMPLRDDLKTIYGTPVKKYGHRMYVLED